MARRRYFFWRYFKGGGPAFTRVDKRAGFPAFPGIFSIFPAVM
jgi:hypothetical protein